MGFVWFLLGGLVAVLAIGLVYGGSERRHGGKDNGKRDDS